MTCPICGCKDGKFSITKKGFGTGHCPHPVDGGCNTQIFPRSDKGTEKLAANVTKWKVPEVRDILGGKAAPETVKAETPAPDVEPDAAPEDVPPVDDADAQARRELFGEG